MYHVVPAITCTLDTLALSLMKTSQVFLNSFTKPRDHSSCIPPSSDKLMYNMGREGRGKALGLRKVGIEFTCFKHGDKHALNVSCGSSNYIDTVEILLLYENKPSVPK